MDYKYHVIIYFEFSNDVNSLNMTRLIKKKTSNT
jgi:hypothetical protein